MNELIELQAKTPAEVASKIAKLKEAKKQIDDKLKELTQDLLQSMQDLDVLTLKTGQLTITRQSKLTFNVQNLEDLEDFFTSKGLYFGTEQVADDITMGQVKEFAKSGNDIDGVETRKTEYVVIKATKAK